MADAVWPVTLPEPLLSGYSVSDDLPLIRTAMESGPERVTRTSTIYTSNVRFSLLLTRDQFATFRNFLDVDCNAGAEWFLISVDTAGSYLTHRCRFTQSPQYSIERPFYRVNCQIETDERHIVLP